MRTGDAEHAPPEALSAFLDGEAPEWAGHVGSCPRCRLEVARLREVVTAVGSPVPPASPAVVERAVARALGTAGPAGGATPDDRPAPMRRRRAAVMAVASGSIAAVLLAVLAAVAVLRSDGDDGPAGTALAPPPEAAQERTTAAGRSTAGLALPGDDLGEVGDPAALAARLSGRIPGTAGGPVAMAARPDSGFGTAAAAPPPAAGAPCEAEARAAAPGLGPLVYLAEGRRDGEPVVVLGFSGAPVTVSVMTREGCGLVFSTTVP